MGIPSYFGWLVRHFEKRIISQHLPVNEIHNIYFDLNCGIHPIARSHPEYTIDQMCDNVVIYLDYLIKYVNPKELIYVAIDGVAPVAKMKQQRHRRFKSAKESMEINQIKKKYRVDYEPNQTDFNMISPATHFMAVLSLKINDYLKKLSLCKIKIIYSDSSVPSEGEHKIMQHIKTQPLDKSCVIYGLDSDLIMLSMCANRSNIMLIRGNTLLKGNEVDIVIDKFPQLNYFIIDELKYIIYNILKNTSMHVSDLGEDFMFDIAIENDMELIIRDYVFMSFLLGNDFVPSFTTLKIRENGIEKIIDGYHTIRRSCEGSCNDHFINDNLLINVPFLSKLINLLSTDEDHDFKQIDYKHNKRGYTNTPNVPHNEESEIDQYQKVEYLWDNYIDPNKHCWEKRYYEYFFHIKPEMYNIKTICSEYMKGLQWIATYYFDKCHDWYWYYPYEATPLLIDLKQHINLHESSPDIDNDPLPPYFQLFMILPPHSLSLLPKPYHSYMISDHSPFKQYFPDDFKLEFYGKRYRWEAHPRIPLINPYELEYHLGHVYSLLSQEEQERGKIRDIITYN